MNIVRGEERGGRATRVMRARNEQTTNAHWAGEEHMPTRIDINAHGTRNPRHHKTVRPGVQWVALVGLCERISFTFA